MIATLNTSQNESQRHKKNRPLSKKMENGFNILYVLLTEMEEIVVDKERIEQDVETLRCNLIVYFQDFLKCINDSVSYFFGQKRN